VDRLQHDTKGEDEYGNPQQFKVTQITSAQKRIETLGTRESPEIQEEVGRRRLNLRFAQGENHTVRLQTRVAVGQ